MTFIELETAVIKNDPRWHHLSPDEQTRVEHCIREATSYPDPQDQIWWMSLAGKTFSRLLPRTLGTFDAIHCERGTR